MASFTFDHIKITGVSSAVPKKKVSSMDFDDVFGVENVRKFVDMTGIREHREASAHQTAGDLGYAAAEKLIQDKQIDRDTIGFLLFGSLSGDYRRPSTAAVLHKRLKLSQRCGAFDVGLGCSAFVYCLQIAASMLMCSSENRALIIVGETLSRLNYESDKSTRMMFGDGGAAVLLEKTNEAESIISGEVCTDGNGYKAIIVPAGGFRNMKAFDDPIVWADGNKRTLYNINMNGTDVFSFTVTKVPKTIKTFLQSTNQDVNDFDCLAFHQANQFIHQQLAKKLKADINKMPLCLDRYGNTSAPAIPMVLSDIYGSVNNDKLLNILMCGFGVGLSWGVASARIKTSDIFPIIETDECFMEGIIQSAEDLK